MSSAYVASNKASSTVAANFNATATSFTIATGEGDRFPSPTGGDYTLLVLQNTSGVREIICVVGRTADTFTVGIPGSAAANVAGRNYESIYGMAAAAWVIGDVVSCRPTAGLLVTAVAATAAAAAAQSTANTGVTNAATAQATADAALPKSGGTMTGDLAMGAGTKIVFEGTTADAYELTVDPGEPTADRTQTHQDASGTLALIESNQAQTGIAYTTGGTSTAYTLTPTPAITALAENQEFDVEFNAAAGATPTLAVSGLTAKLLKYRDSTGAKQAVTATQIPIGWRSKVVYDGTDYIVREVPPAAAGLTLATPQATTSGTEIDFGSIPAGTKRITAVLDGVSTNGTSNLLLQLGTAGGIQTSTYAGACYGGQDSGAQSLNAWTTGVALQHAGIVAAADVLRGVVTFTLMDSTNNIWGVTGTMYRTGAASSYNTLAGTITLSGAVTTLRLTTAGGSDTVDAGSMNIAYE